MRDFFKAQGKDKNQPRLSRLIFGKQQSFDEAAEGYMNDHSRAIYLMAPDNKFLAFYSLDLSETELTA